MRARGTVKVFTAVAVAAGCGVLGFAAAGLAASGSANAKAPLSQDHLTQIQSDLNTATTLELRAIADLKKVTPKTEKNLRLALRRAKADLTAASTTLVTDGFRTSSPFNPISNAGNDVGIALSYQPSGNGVPSKFRAASTVGLLRTAISLEKKALALLPPLAVTPTTTATTGTTTGQTTTSG